MKDLKKVTKLAVFDFDGTLVNSPLPDEGKVEYERKTGTPWPHKGWWGQADSLNTDVFDITTKPEVIADYKIVSQQQDTMKIMLTGRMTKLSSQVQSILSKHGLVFDGYFYNTGGSTDRVKLKSLEGILDQFPLIKEIMMWEDRLLHIEIFKKWGEEQCSSGRLASFDVRWVKSDDFQI
jgi:hypothetical protein